MLLTPKRLAALAGIGLSLALLAPAEAQFWDWGRPQRIQRYNPFREWLGGFPRYRDQDREGGGERERTWDRDTGGDSAHAPAPAQKRSEATIPIVVLGDANADWLAYGLEDAFSEKPEINVVRKHRTDSGLIRYDPRREADWAQAAREIIAAEKPKFIIMMIGNNDRQSIREKAPAPARPAPGKPGAAAQQQQPPGAQATTPALPAEPQPQEQPATNEQATPNATPDQNRTVWYSFEFHSEKWEIAYIKRVDATIAALKSAGVPVIWVGLASQRGAKGSADSSYLNEIYRSRAEKAGITYVDIWDGFVDDGGRFSFQGPDYEGQIRRLRSGDGVYFTRFGARKLALYVEREIQRQLVNHPIPVALPSPGETVAPASNAKPGASSSQRPNVGPVVPLTAPVVSSDELLGGGRQNRTPATDASTSRVLTKGEAISAPSGRADDFSWPRSTVNIETTLEPTPASAPAADNPAAKKQAGAPVDGAAAANNANAIARRARTEAPQFRLPFFLQNIFR